jgi:phage-related protein
VARIIGEAGIRLTASERGLALEIRNILRKALREASDGVDAPLTKPVRDDADESSRHVRGVLGSLLGAARSAGAGIFGAVTAGLRLTLIGTAAAGAVAGVVSLATTVGALGGALLQASGVAALLPAILAGIVAVNATLKIGLTGIGDAFKAVGADSAEFEEAIKDLAPAAQEFMRGIRAMKPALDGLRLDVQQRLFAGLAGHLENLGERYLPIANDLFGSIADSINASGHELANFLRQGEVVGQVNNLTDNLKQSFANLAPALTPAISALLDITEVGSRFLPQMTSGISDMATEFSEFIRGAAADGSLEAWFQNAIDVMKQLGRIGGNVFAGLGNVMRAAQTAGGGLLANLEQITASFRDFTGSASGQNALVEFFASIQRIIAALGPAFFSLIEVLARDLFPILADIAQVIGPVLAPLFQAIGRLLQALRPLIEAVAKAFGVMLEALEPVIDAFAEALTEAMPELAPMIAEIGEAFANLIKSMAPLAPVFVDLLKALLPIIPPIIQMVADLMPRFVDLLIELMPLIEAWARAFIAAIPVLTDVVGFLLDVFIPVFGFIIDVISGLLDFITWAVGGIRDIIVTVFTWIGGFLSDYWGAIADTFSVVWNKIAAIFQGGLSGIAERIGAFAQNAIQWFKDMMSRIVNAVRDGLGNVVDFFRGLPGKIRDAFGNALQWLYNVGRDLVNGLVNGIKSAVQRVIDTVRNMVSDAIATAKAILGVASPSKEFHAIGEFVSIGLADGINDAASAATKAAADLARAVMEEADGLTLAPDLGLTGSLTGTTGAGGTGSAGGPSVILHQTNVMQPGTDVPQFATEVFRNGAHRLASAGSTLNVAVRGSQSGRAGDDFLSGVQL